MIDPWGGSYYVERLTHDLAARAWEHIAEVEESGGMAHAIEAEGIRFGHLVLGEKSTGRSYVAEDLDLLAEASRETAICVHRINLKQDFVDEVVARHRVEEMNRFRTQFFAQFAHDLRSPLT